MACSISYSKMDKACNNYTDIAREFAPDWHLRDRQFKLCNVRYMNNGNGNCVVMGKVNSFLNKLEDETELYVQWWAANRPTNVCNNAGFCLPYPNETIAYQNTPNAGVVPIKNKQFVFDCKYPSGYYKGMGSKFVKPNIRFRFCDNKSRPVSKVYVLKLSDFQLHGRIPEGTNPTQHQAIIASITAPLHTSTNIIQPNNWSNPVVQTLEDPRDTNTYDQPQYVKLIQKGMIIPSWVRDSNQ